MHVTQHDAAKAGSRQRLRRAACAAVCVSAVLLGHGALWVSVAREAAPVGVRSAAVQVRHLAVPPPTPARLEPQPTHDAPSASGAAKAMPATRPRATRSSEPSTVAVATSQTAGAAESDAADTPQPGPAAASVGASPVETYATRIPSSTQLNYTLQRGAATGEATLHWQVDEGRYQLQLQATLPQGRAVEQRSQGNFDAAGLAPVRLADRRRGRDVRAANFQREQRKISFSGPRWEWPLYSGAQDRLSWLVQLVAIATGAPDAMHEGAELSMWVVGTRGAFSVWRFEVRGRQQLAAPSGDASAWWLVREPEHPYDLRVEVWLDPARGYWPLRLRQTQVPGGEPLEWTLRDEPQKALGS